MTLIFTILFIAILILIHEWGHFYTARRLGVRVEEFGFGFPPRLFSRVRSGVRYSVNLLPLGGFVKIFGEHGEGEGNSQSFISRPAGHRFLILFAGIAMNFVLAWLLFTIAAGLGVPRIADQRGNSVPVSIVAVERGSPAEKAGLKFGDKILEMRGDRASLRIESEKDIRDFVDAYRGEEVTIVVERGGTIREFQATPRGHVSENQGPLGVGLARLTLERTAWYRAPIAGAELLGRSLAATVLGLKRIIAELLTQGRAPEALSGPVGIFSFAQDSRALGFNYFLQFIGVLSVNLGFLNFLPIPALDGGRILFLAIEKMKGRRIDPKIENLAHTFGFILLVLLMILVTYRDVTRLF